jgi:putative ABC transport system permease protein
MILFLLKGLVRDRSRSLFPVLTVIVGVTLTVVLYSWVKGTQADLVRASAAFSTGHVRVAPAATIREADGAVSDLVLDDVPALQQRLSSDHPALAWTPRIRFGGLLDLPDAQGETRAQAPVAGLAIDLLGGSGLERRLLNLDRALTRGRLPRLPQEVLVSDTLFTRLGLREGETATLIATTRFGSLATANLRVVGAVRFGVSAIDRGALLADVGMIRAALDMEGAATELLGFYRDDVYRDQAARQIADDFNRTTLERPAALGDATSGGDLRPTMRALRDQGGLASALDLADVVTGALITVFVVVMSIVLWNAGLMGSLRRYGEIGVRLAIGERKGHVYATLVAESLMVGLAGAISYYLEAQGLDISRYLKNASMLISDVLRARVTTGSFLVGFIPGLLGTLLGTSLSGLGIYRRETARLAKELES